MYSIYIFIGSTLWDRGREQSTQEKTGRGRPRDGFTHVCRDSYRIIRIDSHTHACRHPQDYQDGFTRTVCTDTYRIIRSESLRGWASIFWVEHVEEAHFVCVLLTLTERRKKKNNIIGLDIGESDR